jgi:hypothetical protein
MMALSFCEGGTVRRLLLVPLWLSLACPKAPAPPVTPKEETAKSQPLVVAPALDPSEIGILSLRVAAASSSAVCVYGGWFCPSGQVYPLLRCSTDAGKSFAPVQEAARCGLVADAQISSDGSSLWFSCSGTDQAPYLIFSNDGARSFSASEPLLPKGDLVAWTFTTKKNGLVVLSPEEAQPEIGYIERSTTDGGKTWRTLVQIPVEAAGAFRPEREAGARPAEPKIDSFRLRRAAGADGGPAFHLETTSGGGLLSLSWADVPGACSPLQLPTTDSKDQLPDIPLLP